jgi:hypothetical protein
MKKILSPDEVFEVFCGFLAEMGIEKSRGKCDSAA